jgi:hypothetical protein
MAAPKAAELFHKMAQDAAIAAILEKYTKVPASYSGGHSTVSRSSGKPLVEKLADQASGLPPTACSRKSASKTPDLSFLK